MNRRCHACLPHLSKGPHFVFLVMVGCGGDSGTTGPAPVGTVSVSTQVTQLTVGQSTTARATVLDANGHALSGRSISWSSSNPAVLSVTAAGDAATATALAPGVAHLSATSEGVNGNGPTLTVAARVASVSVTTILARLTEGEFTTATATALDPSGNVFNGCTHTWNSSDPSILSVVGGGPGSPRADVTALSPGQAQVFATCDGVRGVGPQMTVVPRVATVTITLGATQVVREETTTATAVIRDKTGQILTDRVIKWFSVDTGLAVVSGSGPTVTVTGRRQGSVAITANVDDKLGVSPELQVISPPFIDVHGSSLETCARTAAGRAFCMGQNFTGAVGDGTTQPRNVPTPVVGGISFATVAAGHWHTCGLSTSGTAYCWGKDSVGRIGDGVHDTIRTTPTPVSTALTFVFLAVGYEHSCALTAQGAAWCWGWNTSGQLGDGTTLHGYVPTAVTGGLQFVQIAAGNSHTCALTNSGAAYCWGSNYQGSLGDGTTIDRLTPGPVAGGLQFTQLTAGVTHTCGRTAAGDTYCWGGNTFGALGDGTFVGHQAPTAVLGGHKFEEVSAGDWHTCARTSAGAAYCWGSNSVGELGNDGAIAAHSPVPVAVVGGLGFVRLSRTCGLVVSGRLYCWGPAVNPATVLKRPTLVP